MSEMFVHKVILSTKKVVILRDMKIKYKNLAVQIAGKKVKGDNPAHLSSMMTDELAKLLILEIDGKPVDKAQVEDLDSLFSFVEYTQVTKAISKIAGFEEAEDDEGKPQFQMEVETGSKPSPG